MSNQEHRSQPTDATQETRARIIEGAYHVLAEKGYDAATLREIARASEAAPGLVHYYFGGKDQLLVEVLRAVGDRLTSTTQQLLQTAPHEGLAEAALAQPFERVVDEPEWYRLRYELFALGLHNTTLAPGVKQLLDEGRRSIGATAAHVLGKTAVDSDVLASILLACFDGLALQKLMDPDIDLDAAYRALVRMLRCLQVSDE